MKEMRSEFPRLAARPGALPVEVMSGADHYVFLAPCSPRFAARLPFLCTDPPGVDRSTIHEALNSRVIAFFRRYLDYPAVASE